MAFQCALYLAAVHVLDRCLPVKEEDVVLVRERADEIRSWNQKFRSD